MIREIYILITSEDSNDNLNKHGNNATSYVDQFSKHLKSTITNKLKINCKSSNFPINDATIDYIDKLFSHSDYIIIIVTGKSLNESKYFLEKLLVFQNDSWKHRMSLILLGNVDRIDAVIGPLTLCFSDTDWLTEVDKWELLLCNISKENLSVNDHDGVIIVSRNVSIHGTNEEKTGYHQNFTKESPILDSKETSNDHNQNQDLHPDYKGKKTNKKNQCTQEPVNENKNNSFQENIESAFDYFVQKTLGLYNMLSSDNKTEYCGPSGLANTSDTCYMNSMIQALAASNKLLVQLKELRKRNDKSEKLKKFVNVLENVNQHKGVGKCTRSLKEFMKTVEWHSRTQEDVFQLLSFFINSVENDLLNNEAMPPKFKILHTFSDDERFNKIQDYLALAIPLCGSFASSQGVDLVTLLDEFFKKSPIDIGPNTTTMYIYGQAPEVMLIHIQANEWNYNTGRYIKPKYSINYSKTLKYHFNIQQNLKVSNEQRNAEVEYQLVAVVQHMGSVSRGHYVTYRQHRQRWYLTDDGHTSETQFECKIDPYIMVYEKM